jgi:hypothetical protein
MAKRRTSSAIRVVQAPAAKAPVIRVVAPSAPRQSRSRRAGRVVRRAASAAGSMARDETHTLVAIGAAGAIGLAERLPQIQALSIIPGVGPAGTLGLAAWVAGKITKSKTAQHMATGLLSVAIFNWAKSGTVSGGTVVGFVGDDE